MKPRILVVEDEVLIALDLVEQLEAAGFQAVGPCYSVSEALARLRDHDCCDAAVLDINLGRENAEPVAVALAQSGTPFVIVSGLTAGQYGSPIFNSVSSLTKPLQPEHLVAKLRGLLRLQ